MIRDGFGRTYRILDERNGCYVCEVPNGRMTLSITTMGLMEFSKV